MPVTGLFICLGFYDREYGAWSQALKERYAISQKETCYSEVSGGNLPQWLESC